jgi:hypothetical protein
VNNVYVKLQGLLQKKILGIRCNAHILSKAINTASCAMPIDVEVIITTLYLYFSRFTVRVATLKQFCEDANVEYKKPDENTIEDLIGRYAIEYYRTARNFYNQMVHCFF